MVYLTEQYGVVPRLMEAFLDAADAGEQANYVHKVSVPSVSAVAGTFKRLAERYCIWTWRTIRLQDVAAFKVYVP
jgi:hypothetical protein